MPVYVEPVPWFYMKKQPIGYKVLNITRAQRGYLAGLALTAGRRLDALDADSSYDVLGFTWSIQFPNPCHVAWDKDSYIDRNYRKLSYAKMVDMLEQAVRELGE